MTTAATLGVDVGTGSTKAALVDHEGRVLAVARAAHPIAEPRPGWSESDPDHWLASTTAAVGDVLAQAPDASVRAIGWSGQMHGVVACGPDGAPVRPAVLWSDRRAQPLLGELRARLGAGALARLANPVVAGMAGPTLAALRRQEPDGPAIARVVQPKDWVRWQLTGVVATEPSDASATLLWDAARDGWSDEACDVFGVDPDWLPPVHASDEVVGHLSRTWSTRLGLPVDLPVVAGAADTAAALLGAGVAPGRTQVTTGTGGQVARLLDVAHADPARRTHLFRSADPGHWYAMAAIQNVGLAIDWALHVLGVDLQEAGDLVEASPPGATGVTFLPYLTGERTPHLDADLTGRWVGLHRGAGRPDLVRAVFEGVAFALRDGLDALRAAGHPVDSALLAGGGSTAAWWQQLLADALQVPLVPHDAADASVRGAGLLAWRGLGHRVDPGAAVTHGAPVEPAGDALEDALARFRAAGPTVS